MNKSKKIYIVMSQGVMLLLIMTLHLIYNAINSSESGMLWMCGIKAHGSIFLDITIWSMILIQFIIMFLILMEKE